MFCVKLVRILRVFGGWGWQLIYINNKTSDNNWWFVSESYIVSDILCENAQIQFSSKFFKWSTERWLFSPYNQVQERTQGIFLSSLSCLEILMLKLMMGHGEPCRLRQDCFCLRWGVELHAWCTMHNLVREYAGFCRVVKLGQHPVQSYNYRNVVLWVWPRSSGEVPEQAAQHATRVDEHELPSEKHPHHRQTHSVHGWHQGQWGPAFKVWSEWVQSSA